MGNMNVNVWAIAEKDLFEKNKWDGFKQDDMEHYLQLFREKGQFLTRGPLENDQSFKQIIPQIVLRVGDKFLLHQITEKTSEQRLKNLWPIFVGGHVEEIDVRPGQDIAEVAADREFQEEVLYNGKILSKKCLGLVYIEDGNTVNHCHVGLIYLYTGDSEDAQSRESVIDNMNFVTLDELKKNEDKLTYWSRMVLPVLEKDL